MLFLSWNVRLQRVKWVLPTQKVNIKSLFKCGLLDIHISPFARPMNLKHPVITGLFSFSELESPCEMVSCQSATAIKLCVLTLVSNCQRTKTGSGLIWESCLPQPPQCTPADPLTHMSYSACQPFMGMGEGHERKLRNAFPFHSIPRFPRITELASESAWNFVSPLD